MTGRAAGAGGSVTAEFLPFLRTVVAISRWRLAGALLLMIAVGLTAGAAVLVLIPLVHASGIELTSRADGAPPFVTTVLRAAGQHLPLELALIAFVAVTAVHGFVGWMQARTTVAVTQDVIVTLRRRVMAALYETDWAFYATTRSSQAAETLLRSTERVGYATHDLLMLVTGGFTAAVYVALAAAVSLPITLFVCAAGLLMMVLLRGRRQAALRLGSHLTAMDQRLYRTVSESLASMKIARSYGAETRHRADFDDATHDARVLQLKLAGSPALVRLYFDAGTAVVLAITAYVSIRHLAVTPAYLLVLLVVFLRLAPWLSSIQVYGQSLLAELPAFANVTAFERQLQASSPPRRPSPSTAIPFARDIRLEHVSFAYGDSPILQDVNLQIPAGQTVAIVGPSGAGKTTVGDVILGLLRPASGRVLIDGEELTINRGPDWRRQIGYVPQDTFLFHDSIRANLDWAAPGATEDQLRAALQAASADFVDRLPAGLDTIVGDRGGLLSGGERQRLALARAFLRSPRLLVLDEATSSLDSENETLIHRALDRARRRVAVLLIAHRLVTARGADIIYVLEGGRVVEQGSWDDLLSRQAGRFRALCLAQGIEAGRPRSPRPVMAAGVQRG